MGKVGKVGKVGDLILQTGETVSGEVVYTVKAKAPSVELRVYYRRPRSRTWLVHAYSYNDDYLGKTDATAAARALAEKGYDAEVRRVAKG